MIGYNNYISRYAQNYLDISTIMNLMGSSSGTTTKIEGFTKEAKRYGTNQRFNNMYKYNSNNFDQIKM